MKRIALKLVSQKREIGSQLKLHLSLISTLALSLFLFQSPASMAEVEAPELVEVDMRGDNLSSYKVRRGTRGYYVGLHKEDVTFKSFTSAVDGKTYVQLFGDEPITLALLSANYKINGSLGSFAAGVEFGKGSIKDNLSGQDRSMEVLKTGVSFKVTADMLFSEPYLAPYFGMSYWTLDISEASPTISFSEKTQPGMNYTAGILLQLNWLDLDASRTATFNWGLENTFLDFYITQYEKTSSVEDPDTTSETVYGSGLRLEF